MENWKTILTNLVSLMGFHDSKVEFDEEHRKGEIFIYDQGEAFEKSHVPTIIDSLNRIAHIIAQKREEPPVHIDVNNYRKKRESLIEDLAKASARKAVATTTTIELPAMNSYERRLVHVALAEHPEVETDSEGQGKGRHVVVRPLTASQTEESTN